MVIVEHKLTDMIPTIQNLGLQFEVVPNCVRETDNVVTGPDLKLFYSWNTLSTYPMQKFMLQKRSLKNDLKEIAVKSRNWIAKYP